MRLLNIYVSGCKGCIYLNLGSNCNALDGFRNESGYNQIYCSYRKEMSHKNIKLNGDKKVYLRLRIINSKKQSTNRCLKVKPTPI